VLLDRAVASSSETTARHSMLCPVGCRKILCNVFR
jgi:hypothetical protein